MMKLTGLLACVLCIVALISTFETRRAAAQPAALKGRVFQFENYSHGRAQQPRQRRKKKQQRSAPLPVVRELDTEGLKKILQRDASAPRPLLINFWATWCPPCREEFPDLVRIDQDYKRRNLDFVIVSLDDPADLKTAVPLFLRVMRAQMPAYLLNVADPNAAISAVDPEWAGGMPATFLLDSSGQVVFKHIGPIKPEELRAELEKVISDK